MICTHRANSNYYRIKRRQIDAEQILNRVQLHADIKLIKKSLFARVLCTFFWSLLLHKCLTFVIIRNTKYVIIIFMVKLIIIHDKTQTVIIQKANAIIVHKLLFGQR